MNTSTQPDCRLSRCQRLVRSSLFKETFAQRQRIAGRYMVLWLRKGEGASLRLGVVASRKIGGAVTRNRAKRRLREAFRLNRHRFRGEVDVVLIARHAITSAPWPEVQADLLKLADKAGLVVGHTGNGDQAC